MKNCKRCLEQKDSSAFSKHTGFSAGVNSTCKVCKAKEQRARPSGKYSFERDIKKKYGLSLSEYDAMVSDQAGHCKICNETGHKLNIDHCHITGNVRGLLCTRCNTGLGKFKDSPDLLREAIAYLEDWSSGKAAPC